jgi:hypothetical protein
MKKFSIFQTESKKSLAKFHAKRLNLVGDGHGGWYGRKTGEFVAKTDGKNLKFYNQGQRLGKKDPKQLETNRHPNKISSAQKPNVPLKTEEYLKRIRENYIEKKIFLEGTWIKSLTNEMTGKIIRRGTNYLICVTEDNIMFKPWIHDVVELLEYENIKLKSIKEFINKYKLQKVNIK